MAQIWGLERTLSAGSEHPKSNIHTDGEFIVRPVAPITVTDLGFFQPPQAVYPAAPPLTGRGCGEGEARHRMERLAGFPLWELELIRSLRPGLSLPGSAPTMQGNLGSDSCSNRSGLCQNVV